MVEYKVMGRLNRNGCGICVEVEYEGRWNMRGGGIGGVVGNMWDCLI